MRINLTVAACQHITYLCNERAWRDTLLEVDAGELRRRFVVLARDPKPGEVELSPTELRALDMLLTDHDPREGKLPDGSPVMELVDIVWDALYQIGKYNAGHKNDDENVIAHTGDGTTAG